MFILIVLMFVIVVSLYLKIRALEAKMVDVTPQDLYPFIEEMRELVIESEQVAERLDNAIKQKEEALEDLIDVASARADELRSLENFAKTNNVKPPLVIEPNKSDSKNTTPITVKDEEDYFFDTDELDDKFEPSAKTESQVNEPYDFSGAQEENPIKKKILELHRLGQSESEIARKLNISTTEVKIVMSINNLR